MPIEYIQEKENFDTVFEQSLRIDRSVTSIRKLEAAFKRNFLTKIREAGFWGFAIESERTSAGIPDCYCAMNGQVMWIELKICPGPLGALTKPRYQPGQRKWLLENMIRGGLSIVGMRFTNGYVFARADVVCTTYGGIPFEDPAMIDYYLPMRVLDVKHLANWALAMADMDKHPLLTMKILEKGNLESGDNGSRKPKVGRPRKSTYEAPERDA